MTEPTPSEKPELRVFEFGAKWVVWRPYDEHLIAEFDSKEEAIERAERLAKKLGGAVIQIGGPGEVL